MILVLVMVFSLMPALSTGRAIAAKQPPEGDVVCRRTQSADVYFEMLDNRDGKPIDVDKIKEKKREVYEGYPDFFEQGRKRGFALMN